MIKRLTIRGLVQGVGFRPFIYLLAHKLGIKGRVANCNNGVIISASFLSDAECDNFIKHVLSDAPDVAAIHEIKVEDVPSSATDFTDFMIMPSISQSDEVTQVAPDIAVCDACLKDRKTQAHRIAYPFINCTHCGPRFTIVEDLPYDRSRTTMSSFVMCNDCANEYSDIYDRRFHAQPVACNQCGPVYYAYYEGKYISDYEQLLDLTSGLLSEGKVIAAKGVGGYHLICDAANASAVSRLRQAKHRDSKPFAVMFKDLDSVTDYTYINEREREVLTSWRRPIVLLRQKQALAAEVNKGTNTLGCMLPYMPLHYDWFERIDTQALVVTSANISDLPIAISADEVEEQFLGKVELFLHHNREIYNRVDDSVVQVCGGQLCPIRRSRGYVPEPFFADTDVEGILAFGAEKVNTFALGKGDTIIQSQYIGDLKNAETLDFYTESMTRFSKLFRFSPSLLACDLHPDYLSTDVAVNMSSDKDLPLVRVQHHHAHAAACMLEYGIDEAVVAVVWDGTGLGDDGKAWGGEFFLCDRKQYKRLSHFQYVPMPGGDKASEEPWRMAVAYLHHYGRAIPSDFVKRIGQQKVDMIRAMIDKNINTPFTSAAGRLFDALASILALCDTSTRQAEAPVLLEQCASDDYSFRYRIDAGVEEISLCSFLQAVLDDLEKGVSVNMISAKIHNGLAHLILEQCKWLLAQTGASKVVVSGGCFQNKRLVEHLQILFAENGIALYIPSKIPCNDSGISVGQLAIAAALRGRKE